MEKKILDLLTFGRAPLSDDHPMMVAWYEALEMQSYIRFFQLATNGKFDPSVRDEHYSGCYSIFAHAFLDGARAQLKEIEGEACTVKAVSGNNEALVKT